MKTRKSSATKKTPPAKKSAVKSQATPTSSEQAVVESPVTTPITNQKPISTPKSSNTTRTPVTRGKKATSAEPVSTNSTPSSATTDKPISSPEAVSVSAPSIDATPAVEATEAPDAVVPATTRPKRGTVKVVRKVVRKVVKKVPVSAKAASGQAPKSGEPDKPEIEETIEKNDLVVSAQPETVVNDQETAGGDTVSLENVDVKLVNEEAVLDAAHSVEGLTKSGLGEIAKREEELGQDENYSLNISSNPLREQDPVAMEVNSVEVVDSDKQQKEPECRDELQAELRDEQGEESKEDEVQIDSRGEEVAMDEELKERGERVTLDEKPKEGGVRVTMGEGPKEGGGIATMNEEPEDGVERVTMDKEPIEGGVGVAIDQDPIEGGERVTLDEDPKEGGERVKMDEEPKDGGKRVTMDEEPKEGEERVAMDEEPKDGEERVAMDEEPKEGEERVRMNEEPKDEKTDFDGLLEEADDEEVADHEVDGENSRDDYADSNMVERCEEAVTREEEHAAQERRLRKEFEIFVGGLDRDVVEEDLKRVFKHAGEVVDVRLYKDPATNKNKGYAFVRFAEKEHVTRALAEMKNPVICGKRCGIAPSEDNDTLFVGNICNTWTKEAVKQKLKDYGIKSVERITLVTDPKHEGLSRGFAFVEFSCHAEAMKAYNRLQKPDVVLGHSERTAKVAFAEPLREPDPEVMLKVKSVFIDGLPPNWDEDRVRSEFKQFGEIAQITLARNMPSAKRKDFGFVDFGSHEAAVACIECLNNTELGDGNYKAKVRVRLSNPEPKTQAVKGEMVGGFRIAQIGGGTLQRSSRGFGRAGDTSNRGNFQHTSNRGNFQHTSNRGNFHHTSNRGNFQHTSNRGNFHHTSNRGNFQHTSNRGNFQPGRGFYPRAPDYNVQIGLGSGRGFGNPFPPSHGRGGRWGFRSSHSMPNEVSPPIRPNLNRARNAGHDMMRRQPFLPEGGLDRPFSDRHFDDPYFYEDSAPGMKRPYHMTDHNPDYVEPSSRRARYDYSETLAPHHEGLGPHAGPYPQDRYASDYGRDMRPSFYGGDRSYGRGYYY